MQRAPLILAVVLAGCTPAIEMPAPAEFKAKQVGYGPSAAVELSWRVVIRAGGYLLEYGDHKGGPYNGAGLGVVRWALGCGDFDGGAAPTPADAGATEAGPADAGWPAYAATSPVRIPARWCLELANTYSDAGFQPSSTPAARPRVRLSGLTPGKTYHFIVRSFRLASTSASSAEVAFTPAQDAPKGSE